MKRFILSFLFFTNISFSQMVTTWSTTIGGPNNEWARDIKQTEDGGFIIAGNSNTNSSTDGYLVKTNSSGDTLWTKLYGGSNEDKFHSVVQTTDGGYAMTGWTNSTGAGDYDLWLVKTDANGDTLWTRTFGSTSTDLGYSIVESSDGGLVMAGSKYVPNSYVGTPAWMIKTDSVGTQLWEQTLEDYTYYAGARCINNTSDGGYIISGQQLSAIGTNFFLSKIGADGSIDWINVFFGDDPRRFV